MAIKYRYTGAGEFIPGVPARDITDDDLKELPDVVVAALTESAKRKPEEGGIYEAVTQTATKTTREV